MSCVYFLLQVPHRQNYCYLEDEAKGVKQPWLLRSGERLADKFPMNASFYMSKDEPGMKLDDFIANKFRRLFVSERVQKILANEPIDIEWLPVTLVDKKDRPVTAPYFIANVLGKVDCIDLARSDYDRSSFKPEEVLVFRCVQLDPAKIPDKPSLFRIKDQPSTFIIRSDLVEKLNAAKAGGFSLLELGTSVLL
ncbi:imm11 family protein [Cystobacter fuscus]|uniref:imm11 family protein n=1 Tax=Cystobacter fuscus TaxID=43 RepID=UPI002B2E3086|nr:hypothetical protein F0U63_39930 [Cystobacter fuscus]